MEFTRRGGHSALEQPLENAVLVGLEEKDAGDGPQGGVSGGRVGGAPGHGDGGAGAEGPPDALAGLACGLAGHGAGVDDNEAGGAVARDRTQAGPGELLGERLALGLVDLAAERNELESKFRFQI
jgi:hypothetical protein